MGDLVFAWRGSVADDEVDRLHAAAFNVGAEHAAAHEWWVQVNR